MTNKEKAREIADNFFLDEDIELTMAAKECNISCKNAALEMAEWKDEEFNLERKVLLEKIESLKEQRAALRMSNEKFRKGLIDKASEWIISHNGDNSIVEEFLKAITEE